MIRIHLLLLALLIFTSSCFARMGWGDWQEHSPNGTFIYNLGGGISMKLGRDTSLVGVKEWYFYKDHIIGYSLLKDSIEREEYFIASEHTRIIKKFNLQSDWDKYIDKNSLRPLIWTRKYNGDWTFFDDGIVFFFIVFFPVSIPATVFFFYALFRAIRKESFNLRKPYTKIFLGINIFIFLFWFLEQFPGSI